MEKRIVPSAALKRAVRAATAPAALNTVANPGATTNVGEREMKSKAVTATSLNTPAKATTNPPVSNR